MKARINVVTLAVSDLERALRFYRGLGLSSPGIIGTEFPGGDTTPAGAVAMFTLDDGLVLSLYPRTELAKDADLVPEQLGGSAMSLGWTVDSREEVDGILDTAARAGATIPGPPHERPWGIYSGYFSDPDGHLWEVVHFLP
ncbi:VOC family protein [Nocardia heshunensis]